MAHSALSLLHPQASYKLGFIGYYRDINSSYIPRISGIYCVYTCRHNVFANTVSIDKLLYIGESEDIGGRIRIHNLKSLWKRNLRSGQELCYSWTPIASGRDQAEAALIYWHKPVFNMEHRDIFSYPTTRVITSGANEGLKSDFTTP